MKRHDTRPFLDVALTNVDGNAVDLTITGLTVEFIMKNYDTNALVIASGVCTIIDSVNGKVRYAWDSTDTNTAGTFLGEFEVNYADGTKLTIPTSKPLSIVILEDYDNA